MITDNGPTFVSAEFKEFLHKNGIKHTTSAPYHPATNGLAERAVKIFKEGVKKLKKGTMQTKIDRVLFRYRITPHSTTGASPAEMLMGRKLRSALDLLKPDLHLRVENEQERQKVAHDKHSVAHSFQVGEAVYARNFRPGPMWEPAHIVEAAGTLSFKVRLFGRDVVWHRHQDQLRKRHVTDSDASVTQLPDVAESSPITQNSTSFPFELSPTHSTDLPSNEPAQNNESSESPTIVHRYPQRNC